MSLHPPGQNPYDHDPTRCQWSLKKRGGGRGPDVYECNHGWTSNGHPNGWCDQGCCR